jgi:hypothetical protein
MLWWWCWLACRGDVEASAQPEAAPTTTAPAAAPTAAPPATPRPTGAPGVPSPTAETVLALGDLHADLDNAEHALRLLGVLGADGHWAAGQATFVQTGDVTDRGPDSGAILALLRRLQGEAAAAGGRVVPLLGNHEVMNMQGDLRYVDPGDVAAYGGDAARRAAFGPAGDDGRWLRTLDAVAVIDGTAFVHGGVTPEIAALTLPVMNDAVRVGIDASTEIPLGKDGPLWYRGYVQEPEDQACPRLEQALLTLGARRMVVGHTTRDDGRIQVRCGGRLAVIDTGIADHYGANIAAWRADQGDAKAIYPTGAVDIPDPEPLP